MKTFKLFLQNVSIITTFFLMFFGINGCVDPPAVNPGSVSGTIIDENGLRDRYFLLSSGYYPIVPTDLKGNFTIPNVQKPFNLSITESRFTETFKNINIDNFKITAEIPSGYGKICLLDVHFPSSNYEKIKYIKFISSEQFYQDEYVADPKKNDIVYNLNILIPYDKTSIQGQILFLECSGSSGNIYSFDKYGLKNVTLYPYDSDSLRFSESDISYNPPEQGLDLQTSVPPGANNIGYEVFLNFPSLYKNSGFIIQYPYNDYTTIPVLQGIDYNFKVLNKCLFYTNYPYAEESKKWIFVPPGQNALIIYNPAPKILLPHDMQANVADTSAFEIEDSGNRGVYTYEIFDSNTVNNSNVARLITDEKAVKFRDFKMRGVTFLPNTTYYCIVKKIENYNSIDDYVSTFPIYEEKYNTILASKTIAFKTGP